MTCADLLGELSTTGFRLATNGDRLHVTPPPTGCPDELRVRIVAHKPDLIRLVRFRDRLLILARDVGVPDCVVTGIEAGELQTWNDAMPKWPDEVLQREVLVIYLRTLAGIESALPGSLAERDAPERQRKAGLA